MAGLTKDVQKWLQSLQLTYQITSPKWDLTNGYLIAEIFSWYYPQVEIRCFINCMSYEMKLLNWMKLRKFFARNHIDIPDSYIYGTIHCKDNAAFVLLERIYEMLTKKCVKKLHSEEKLKFNDFAYQHTLPEYAQTTANNAIKSNIKLSELLVERSHMKVQMETQNIIYEYLEHKREAKQRNPARVKVTPHLWELAPRLPPLNEAFPTSIRVASAEMLSTQSYGDRNFGSRALKVDQQKSLAQGTTGEKHQTVMTNMTCQTTEGHQHSALSQQQDHQTVANCSIGGSYEKSLPGHIKQITVKQPLKA